MPKPVPFLRAEWRSLLFLNYQVEAAVLQPYLPAGVELDLWEGRPLVSIVGLQFRGARVLGLPLPFHQRFEQINLRFYARTTGHQPARRGVVFIKEMVPSPWMAAAARLLMGENYHALPTGHKFEAAGRPARDDRAKKGTPETGGLVEYTWKQGRPGGAGRSGYIGRRRLNRLGALVSGPPELPAPGSWQEFVTARHWSFTPRGPRRTAVMRSEHPAWRVSPVEQPYLLCDITAVYGQPFVPFLQHRPHSALLCEGGPVTLLLGYPALRLG